jgi:hypothetical protein
MGLFEHRIHSKTGVWLGELLRRSLPDTSS